MIIDNLSSEALAVLRAKNVPVTNGFDGPVIGHMENIRLSETAYIGDIVLNKEARSAFEHGGECPPDAVLNFDLSKGTIIGWKFDKQSNQDSK